MIKLSPWLWVALALIGLGQVLQLVSLILLAVSR
jgi:hypothetical protein